MTTPAELVKLVASLIAVSQLAGESNEETAQRIVDVFLQAVAKVLDDDA